LSNPRIVLHHVGGRWGNQPFPVPPRFERDFVRVLYEADADAIDGIREATKDLKSQVIIVPACLAEADCQKTLRVSMNPGCTSLLEPATAWNGKYVHLMGIDFDFPDGARVIERRQVSARSMDSLLASPTNSYPDPDFLSLDVQGYEFEILQGARSTLQRSVCGLIVETEFTRLYAGQKRFQDICDFLGASGFAFVRFLDIGELSGPRTPLGFRSSGYQTWADALFLRKLEPKTGTSIDPLSLYKKLCFFAVVFDLSDLAAQCFDFFIESSPCNPFAGQYQADYERFLEPLFDAYVRSNKMFPPLFSQSLPQHRISQFSRASAPSEWPKLLDNLQEFRGKYLVELAEMQKEDDTEFEAVLRRFDFVALAERVKLVRRDQSSKIQSVIEQANAVVSLR
jgi:FkbM family methyltransferase